MFGLNEVPDLSSDGGARKSGVTREIISIFSQIKKAENEERKEELNRLLESLRKKLPEGFKIGAAVGEGDCFFDSVAQGLNELKDKGLVENSERFNVKSLRKDCANDTRKYEDKIVKDANEGGYFVPQKNIAFPHLENIKDKKENDVPDVKETFDKYSDCIENVATENGPIPIWGRLDIEGRMICDKYKVKIKVIELKEQPIGDTNVIESEQGEGTNVITMVNYKNHFVPLLSNLKEDIEEAIEVSREEIYGIPDNKNSHSLTEDTGSYDLEKMKNSKEAYGKKQENDSNSKDKASESMKSLKTVGDGNCFFHAVFGNNSSVGYKAEKAQKMRMEWYEFLSQFTSLDDANMPAPLNCEIKTVFNMFLEKPENLTGRFKKIKELAKETKEKIDKADSEAKKLKEKIIERFRNDGEFRELIYSKMEENVNASNAFSQENQTSLSSIEELREENHNQELSNRISECLMTFALIHDSSLSKEAYGNVYNSEVITDSFVNNKIIYQAYLEAIKGKDYFIFIKEIPMLASLANIKINVQYKNEGQDVQTEFIPNPQMINSNYERKDALWGDKKREEIYHSGNHFSRFDEVIPEQKGEERTSTKSKNKGSSASDVRLLSKDFERNLTGNNYQLWLINYVISDIAEHIYGWTESNNIIFGVEGCGSLPSKLDKFKKNEGKTLIYIVNKDGNHWVTLVAIHTNEQKDVFFYADSFGVGIEECRVNSFGRGKIDSDAENKASQGNADRNGQNVEQNSDGDVIFVKETVPLEQDINGNIRMSLDEFLERQGYSKNNTHSVSCNQQYDKYNCGVFALENAKAILNAVKDGNGDPNKVKESLEAVNKDIEYLNRLRKSFASSLEEVSSINKQSSVAFSSSSEKGIEESIEREPLHNCEESEKQALRELKEISSKYILTDKEKENELSNFIKIQPSCRTKNDRKNFDELWKNFVRLSPDEKEKAILRIFFLAEFWDSSVDENENALRNVVWEEVGNLNAKDYIFRKSVDYLISFASTPSPSECLISTGKRLHSNGLRQVLSRAQSFLSKDEMGNLIIRICIEIFSMRNTFNVGELFTSNKVKERLSTLKNFCEGGRKNKIADFTLRDYQDYKILRPLLKERSQPSVKSIIDYLIKKLESEESALKDPLEGFIDDLYEEEYPRKDCSSNQKKEFLKQYNYYLITFAIDQVIQYNESPLEGVLSIAKDHFSEEEMNAMLERACKYIVDQRNKSVEGVAFNSEKVFRLLSDKLNSINRKKEEILKFLVDKLGKIQDFSENCQSSTLQQILEEVVSYSPSRGKNTGNRNHESCSENFFDELTMILDGGKTDKQDKIQSFISSRLSRYKGNCLYRLLLGEFLFENQDHAQISQKYLLLHLDSQSIAFLLTAGQREKAKTTVLSIIDKSRGPVPNISSFAIDYRNLQIVNLEIDSRKSHLLDNIKKEDIEQGYKIKFIPINEEVISLDLLRKAIKDVGFRQQVIYNLNNIINQVNYVVNLDNDKIKFSFIRNEKDCETLVNGLLMGSEHKISFVSEIINEIISSLVKNNIQAKSNNIRDHRLPIADKRSGKKDKKKAEYYAYLSREYGIFSSQADVRGDRAIFNRSAIRENRKRPIINEENYGCNGLHLAITNEKFDDVKKLVEANDGYVKGRDFYGNTPLHFAVQGKNLEILQFLMDYIGKQNHKEDYFVDKNCDGCTPLHFAAGSGNIEVFSKLLKFVGAEAKEGYVKIKNNKGETPLHFAARSGKAEVVSKLLEFVDAKAKEGYVQSKDSKDETPLHFAAKSGNVKVVEKLLEYVNDKEGYVKHENSNKCTPLHFAAWGSNVEVINKLLEFVDEKEREDYVQSKNNKGETPLHFAAKKNDVGVILSLIECVTEREGKENYVKCTNKLLYTPLHFAARGDNVKAVERLLEYINDKEGYVRAENNKKETSLHFAARSGNVEVINKLLEFVGAEAKEGYVKIKNNKGETPLHFATRSNNVKAVERLLEYVNDKEGYVRAENNEKETPLRFAARGDNVKAVERLLQCVGEDEKENYIEFINNDNKNALDIAISCGSWKVFDELLKYIKNLEQRQHYLGLAKQASGSKKRNVYSLDDLQTKSRVEGRKKQRNKELITKKTHSHSEAVKDDNNPCSQSESPTSPYSKKRSRISDGKTQKPQVKKVVLSDSPRQEVKIKSSVGNDESDEQQDSSRERGPEISSSRSSSSGSQEGEQPTLNDVESNGENQEAFSRSSSTSDENDNNNLSEESGSRSSSPDSQKVEHTASNDISERSSGDEESVYSSPEQNSGSSLELGEGSWHTDISRVIEKGAENRIQLLRDLIKGGANPGRLGHTCPPLVEAAQKCDKEVVRFLVNECEVDIDIEESCSGKNAIFCAIKNNNTEMAEFLFSKGAKVGFYSFEDLVKSAAIAGNVSILRTLVNNCTQEKFFIDLDKIPLMRELDGLLNDHNLSHEIRDLLEQNRSKLCTLHPSYGQESNAEENNSRSDSMDSQKDEEGCTRLHIAAAEGNNEFVKTLLKKGDDVNYKNKYGRTSLHDAVVNGNNEIVKTLLEGGASIDSKDKDGYTPLRLALANNEWEIVRILLEKVANDSNMLPIFNALNIEMQSPKTTLNIVTLDNQLRRRSASF